MYFEEFSIGQDFKTRSRVVTPTDIDLFAGITGAVNPLFLQDAFAKKSGLNGRIAPGVLSLSINLGLVYSLGIIDNVIAFLSIDRLKFLASVYPQDTLSANIEVTNKKETEKGNKGIVTFYNILTNQESNEVLEADFAFMVKRKPPTG